MPRVVVIVLAVLLVVPGAAMAQATPGASPEASLDLETLLPAADAFGEEWQIARSNHGTREDLQYNFAASVYLGSGFSSIIVILLETGPRDSLTPHEWKTLQADVQDRAGFYEDSRNSPIPAWSRTSVPAGVEEVVWYETDVSQVFDESPAGVALYALSSGITVFIDVYGTIDGKWGREATDLVLSQVVGQPTR